MPFTEARCVDSMWVEYSPTSNMHGSLHRTCANGSRFSATSKPYLIYCYWFFSRVPARYRILNKKGTRTFFPLRAAIILFGSSPAHHFRRGLWTWRPDPCEAAVRSRTGMRREAKLERVLVVWVLPSPGFEASELLHADCGLMVDACEFVSVCPDSGWAGLLQCKRNMQIRLVRGEAGGAFSSSQSETVTFKASRSIPAPEACSCQKVRTHATRARGPGQ